MKIVYKQNKIMVQLINVYIDIIHLNSLKNPIPAQYNKNKTKQALWVQLNEMKNFMFRISDSKYSKQRV